MIYSFGATNYFSFKEGMEISFELSAKTPVNISQGKRVATVLGVKGANASGKTNVLKAIEFIAHFITESFGFMEDQSLGFRNYFDNDKVSDFYVDFEIDSVRYFYELTATPKKVVREALYKRLQRKTLLVERKANKIVRRVAEFSAIDMVELKSNASLISTTLMYKLKGVASDFAQISKLFSNISGNMTSVGVVSDELLFTRESVSQFYFNNELAFEFAKNIIINSDLGIHDIELHHRENASGEIEYFPLFAHVVGDGSQKAYLTSYNQSSGTMALYRRLGIYFVMLERGGVLVMDEFDQNCHPMLLPQLINLFQDPLINKNGAQFIFTAHNSDIIDCLGKYRTVLVAKEQGESYCYRLDQIPGDLVRNDRSIAALYREGKIGGVPRV
ncbi:AAA family ATPase [Pseudomonas sp. 210_17 TE3656]